MGYRESDQAKSKRRCPCRAERVQQSKDQSKKRLRRLKTPARGRGFFLACPKWRGFIVLRNSPVVFTRPLPIAFIGEFRGIVEFVLGEVHQIAP